MPLHGASLPSPSSAPQLNPSMPLPVSEGLAAEIERGIGKAHLAILNLERYIALLNLCSLAASASSLDHDLARAEESLAQVQKHLAEVQAAGDEAALQQAEVGGWCGWCGRGCEVGCARQGDEHCPTCCLAGRLPAAVRRSKGCPAAPCHAHARLCAPAAA